MQLVASDDKQ